ncbi:hypothetical protein PROFUN_12224 [Planoprotostelium fungivorum]|uniref:Transmembrane protein n=1 Tax=Planoprotostelium fungivorum TaxID=1890364 RepID=A0A2P6N870_9EUKA|nr:hypothetical protein PROFUN_12224 [Planoprotostelium fungivorum]
MPAEVIHRIPTRGCIVFIYIITLLMVVPGVLLLLDANHRHNVMKQRREHYCLTQCITNTTNEDKSMALMVHAYISLPIQCADRLISSTATSDNKTFVDVSLLIGRWQDMKFARLDSTWTQLHDVDFFKQNFTFQCWAPRNINQTSDNRGPSHVTVSRPGLEWSTAVEFALSITLCGLPVSMFFMHVMWLVLFQKKTMQDMEEKFLLYQSEPVDVAMQRASNHHEWITKSGFVLLFFLAAKTIIYAPYGISCSVAVALLALFNSKADVLFLKTKRQSFIVGSYLFLSTVAYMLLAAWPILLIYINVDDRNSKSIALCIQSGLLLIFALSFLGKVMAHWRRIYFLLSHHKFEPHTIVFKDNSDTDIKWYRSTVFLCALQISLAAFINTLLLSYTGQLRGSYSWFIAGGAATGVCAVHDSRAFRVVAILVNIALSVVSVVSSAVQSHSWYEHFVLAINAVVALFVTGVFIRELARGNKRE